MGIFFAVGQRGLSRGDEGTAPLSRPSQAKLDPRPQR